MALLQGTSSPSCGHRTRYRNHTVQRCFFYSRHRLGNPPASMKTNDTADDSLQTTHIGLGMVMFIRAAFASLVALIGLTGSLSAQTGDPVQLTPGFTRLVTFNRSIATVVNGNPEVADARAQ